MVPYFPLTYLGALFLNHLHDHRVAFGLPANRRTELVDQKQSILEGSQSDGLSRLVESYFR